MADSKISNLPASTTPLAGTELAVIVQGGVTSQVAVSELGSGDNFATADLTLTGNRTHDTNSNNLILSTDGATLNEANIGLTTAVAALSFGNTYVDVRSTGLTLFENAMERVSVKPTETVINEAGGSYDFRVEGDTDTSLLFADASTDRVGVGTVLPLAKVDIHADGALTSDIALNVRNSVDTADLFNVDGLGNVYTDKSLTNNGTYITNANSDRDKIRVFNSNKYTIGMLNANTYGGLTSDFAMTFQMSDTTGRGFWWGDENHTAAQGAMALTTTGDLTVASKIRVGYGESDTTTPSIPLDVSGDASISGVVQVGEYTVATLPTASTYQAGTIMVSDETGGYTMAFSDGTNWRRTQDRAIVS